MILQTISTFLGVDSRAEAIWIMIGFGGQFLFMMRFLVQWIVSERAKQSVIPVAFWYFSMGGAMILLSYAIYRGDPVFIMGQSLGMFIYIRNLFLIRSHRKAAALSASTGDGS
ncbi:MULTISPECIES: lipid-A-disaccharide synthase N-terminal domain-containing protein [Roseobacter]|uniref:lipid-A-disaccharide synthase N-terminal domain-containing protein n=1 Tax=Roseobacter TaxID=2433 RepID=UPI001BC389C9|nr:MULTISPECIES: lipid-A-disaccharide synthase N-terminal domain-containing protein [Roseobacter]GIT86652.1 lipid A biosynthesis protein [Roseobacter sp. OBYS 0001]